MDYNSKKQITRLFRLFKEHKIPYLLALISRSVMDSSISIVTAVMVSFSLDAITSKNMNTLYMVCIQFSIVIAVMCILTPLSQYWFGKIVRTITIKIRLHIFHHLEKLPTSYYENTHSGDSLSRITNDLETMEHSYTWQAYMFVRLLVTGIGSAVVMFILDWRFAIAMIILGSLSTYINTYFAKPMRRISAEIQQKVGIQSESLTNLIAGAQVSRIFQMQSIINMKYKESTQNLAELSVARVKKSSYLAGTNYLLLWINNGGALALGALLLINGQITLGSLLGVALLLDNVTSLFRSLGDFWVNLQTSLSGADRVFELLDVEEEPDRMPRTSFEGSDDEVQGIIHIREVSFGYRDEEDVLYRISLNVHKGQVAALVGPSGGGKSTILKLLMGFYPLKLGEIWLDGTCVSDMTLEQVRDKMAYVSQDPYLFDGTIEQNIQYGRMDATSEEIVEAARAAFAHDFIMEQPDGYNTVVGERGARLSGGQKQRIEIARAILKNAPILLLDEATSALDSESEQAVQRGIDRLMEGRTTIAIAHRLSTIKEADIIYVIDNGAISEQGTHNELLESGGLYSHLNLIVTEP